MKYAQYWGAVADHSGDAYFDFVYWHDWPNARSPSIGCRSASPGVRMFFEIKNWKPGWTTAAFAVF